MQPFLMRSDIDPFQVAVIVIFVLASFVKWLWENWQAKRDESLFEPPDPEEQRLRDEAWRRQTGQNTPPPLPPPAEISPWDDLKKAWKELQEVATPVPVPPSAPPVARKKPQPQVRVEERPAATKMAVLPNPALPEPAGAYDAKSRTSRTATVPLLAALQRMRGDPALLRQAILMQEILGPPKALQTSDEPAI